MMTGLRFGRTRKDLDEQLSARNQTVEELRKRGIVVGAGEEMKEQLAELEKVGIQRLMLQWLDLDDLKGLSALARAVM
jgi:alkanesulfonate monooxygenase SsuD/methylene tetrahydromethanopterin reductase-like flavin-dependent oxidoreductase (luciferase family)